MQKQTIIKWLEKFAETIEKNKDYLTELDAAIGDADHGANMERGFKKVVEELPKVADKDIGTIFKTVSMALISNVGGASGPLYGTLFLRASTAVAGKQELDKKSIFKFLKSGLDGVIARGKAELGDKTMIDALYPAIMAFDEAINEELTIVNAVEKAVTAAEKGMKNTIPMIAKKGRASYLGERSKGHQDAGATSVYLMLKSLYESLENE